jgi:hypothetical protein
MTPEKRRERSTRARRRRPPPSELEFTALGPDEDNRIAGEVLVELRQDVAFSVDVGVHRGRRRARSWA